ncbi:MAG: phosphate/phosphite/phosphonate ABC transporter substrate-binding protein [Rhizobiaceae bacterium]
MLYLPKTLVALGLGSLALIANSLPASAQEAGSASKTPAMDWREKLGTFRVGIIGGNRPILESRRMQPFKEALQKELGVPVEVFAASDYKVLIEAHRSGRIEYAIYSASAFSAGWLLCKCIEPLVSPVAADGATGFRSILLSSNKHTASLSSLKGKTIVIPGRKSFSGYLLPRGQLALDGVDIENAEWKIADSGNAINAIADLEGKNAAGVFGWEPYYGNSKLSLKQVKGTRALMIAKLGAGASEYPTLWQSSPISHGPHAVRKSLDGKVKALLAKFMINLNQRNFEAYGAVEPNFSGGFREVTISHYQSVIDLLRTGNNAKKASLPDNFGENKKTP